MKAIYFYTTITLLFSGIFSACIKSPILDTSQRTDGEWIYLFNDTGVNPTCGEGGTKVTFILTSDDKQEEFIVEPDASMIAFFEIEPGETLNVNVVETKTNSRLTRQKQEIHTLNNRDITSTRLSFPTIRLCPKDKMRFINF